MSARAAPKALLSTVATAHSHSSNKQGCRMGGSAGAMDAVLPGVLLQQLRLLIIGLLK
jgi:hypothetical protein